MVVMHLVISGYYGFQNTGDEAILESMISHLKKLEPTIQLTVLSNDPITTCKNYDVEAINRWDIAEVRRVLKKSDGLISGGGSLLQDVTGMGTVIYYTFIIKMARFYKKPVFIYSQGIGPLKSPFAKFMVKSALKHVKGTVRDKNSQTLLSTIGVTGDFSLTPDPVLGSSVPLKETEWIKKQKITKPYITVSLRDWPVTRNYKEKLAAVLDIISEKGYTIVFISMHGSPDSQMAEEISSLMKQKSLVSSAFLTIEEKVYLIASAELLIGMRLHSLIFAANAEVPFAALSYDPKIDSFAEELDQPVLGNVNNKNEEWNVNKIVTVIEQLLKKENYDKYRFKIRSMSKEAEKTAEMAIDYFHEKI